MKSASAGRTVVVAGDSSVLGRFTTALEAAGHRAIAVKGAAELLARVRADLDHIDLVILDLRLPHGAGIDLVRSIRRFDQGRRPILIFSGTIKDARQVRELSGLEVAGYINEHAPSDRIMEALRPYLYPDQFNRRSSPRIILSIPVSILLDDTVSAARTLDLGKGGVAIATMNPQETSTKARTRFRLPSSGRDIETESRVAWSDRRVGMGLQFERVDPLDQIAIDEFVDAHRSPKGH